MKSIAFIVSLFLAVFFVSNTVLAATDSEYAQALKYYNSKKYEEAARIFKDYVKNKPEPSAYYRIGYALYELKKFDEANEYFKQAYLIDPNYSPELAAPAGMSPEEASRIAGKRLSKKRPPAPAQGEEEPAVKPEPASVTAPAPEKPAAQAPQPQKPQEPAVTTEKALQPEPPKVETPKGAQPPAGLPAFPMPKGSMPGPAPEMLSGLIAGFGMIFLVLGIAVYLYACLCIFLIAKKLQVSAPWTAWIPLVQLWTIVSSAGKPGWWVILLIIPIVGAIVYFYLWICITENLGKNKWLGLLMLLPIINFIFMGMLAFSKTEQVGGPVEGVTPA